MRGSAWKRWVRLEGYITMNDGQTILKLQELDSSIRLLAIQRVLYGLAKIWNASATLIGFIIPVAITSLQLAGITNFSDSFCVILGLLFFFLDCFFMQLARRRTENAASIQQVLDSKLFAVDFDNDPIDVNLCARSYCIFRWFGCHMRELPAWYSECIADLSDEEAVLACQQENIAWTSRLYIRFRILIFASAFAVAVSFGFGVIEQGADIANLAFFFAPFQWTFIQLTELNGAIWALRSCDQIARLDVSDRLGIVRETQSIIYAMRKTRAIPGWMYRVFRKLDESLASAEILIDRDIH